MKYIVTNWRNCSLSASNSLKAPAVTLYTWRRRRFSLRSLTTDMTSSSWHAMMFSLWHHNCRLLIILSNTMKIYFSIADPNVHIIPGFINISIQFNLSYMWIYLIVMKLLAFFCRGKSALVMIIAPQQWYNGNTCRGERIWRLTGYNWSVSYKTIHYITSFRSI